MTDQIVELQSLQDPVPGVAEREQVDTEGTEKQSRVLWKQVVG